MAVDNKHPGDLAARMAENLRRVSQARRADGFKRESFVLPRDKAREKAREIFASFPKAAYMTEIEFLAGTGRRADRIHHAPPAERRLSARLEDEGEGAFP